MIPGLQNGVTLDARLHLSGSSPVGQQDLTSAVISKASGTAEYMAQ